jgi:hypothetical protein
MLARALFTDHSDDLGLTQMVSHALTLHSSVDCQILSTFDEQFVYVCALV